MFYFPPLLAIYFHLTYIFVVCLLLLKQVLYIPLNLSLRSLLVKSHTVSIDSQQLQLIFFSLFSLENYTAAISWCGIDHQFH